MIQAGYENRNEDLRRMGLEVAWATGTDVVVDAAIAAGAAKGGVAIARAVGNPPGLIAFSAGVVLFMGGQWVYSECCSDSVDQFGDYIYETHIEPPSQATGRGITSR